MELLGKKLAVAALLGAMVLPAVGAVAADNNGNPAVSVTADTLEYNGKTQVATATGNVVIVRDQATMTGNKAVYNLKTAEADMEGNVSIQQPDMQLNADKVHSTNKNYVVATGSVRGVYDDKKVNGDKVEYYLDQDYGIVTGNGYLEAHIESPAENLVAYANQAVYTQTPGQNDGVIHLTGNVNATQNGNSLNGDNVDIRLADNSVQTRSRSTIVIVPGSNP